jgi:hypothetical protein
MTNVLDDPSHWRNRAEEARSQADEMRSEDTRLQMLKIAEGYDRLALRAEERARSPLTPMRLRGGTKGEE